MKYCVLMLLLIVLSIPCSDGTPPVTLQGVLFDQFNRLTEPPSMLFHVWPILYALIYAPVRA